MTVPAYVVHATEGCARFQHPAFGSESTVRTVVETLAHDKSVLGVRPGHQSILLTLAPSANLEAICQTLERALPELG